MKKIIIKDDEHNINARVSLDSDVTLEEMFDAFKGLLVLSGCSIDGINEYLK